MSQSNARKARRAGGKAALRGVGMLNRSLEQAMHGAEEQAAMGEVWKTLGDEERARAWHRIAAAHLVMADAVAGLLTLGPNEKGEW